MYYFFILLSLLCITANAQNTFDRFFKDKGLRIDFTVTGNNQNSIYGIRQFVEDPIWSGSITQLTDTYDFGVHQLRVVDKENGQIIFSKGFSSLFHEWQTTESAKQDHQSFLFSMVIPYPKSAVMIELYDRSNENGQWVKNNSFNFSPAIQVCKEKQHSFPVRTIVESGHHHQKLDILFIAEGYQQEQLSQFNAVVDTVVEYLFSQSPFREKKELINIRAVQSVSIDSGSDDPNQNIYKQTVVHSTFNTLGIDRYLMCPDQTAIMQLTWGIPCDIVYILTNTQKYGGGGIYNFYGISSSTIPKLKQVFVHELGHTLAGLADEYYTSAVTYESFYNLKLEPWEANITTLADFDKKWKKLISKNIPIPTPDTKKYNDTLGVFEGGGYVPQGIYRPARDCRMKTNSADGFCEVCKNTIGKIINTYK